MLSNVDIIYEKDSFGNGWYRGLRSVMRANQLFLCPLRFGGKTEVKKAWDSDLTFVLEGSALKEAIDGKLHPQFPTKELHMQAYLKEWERGYDWKKQGFSYCYEDRAEAYQGYKIRKIELQHSDFNPGQVLYTHEYVPITIDQWRLARDDIAEQIKSGVSSNRNVIVIGNPSVDRFEIPESPPCLREIWIRWEGNDWLSVKTTWRSRDLYGAWMTNVVGLLSAVIREVAVPNNCKVIQYRDSSASCHIYDADLDAASKVKAIPVVMR